MGRPERALYHSARRLLRRYQAEDIPFTGVAGTNLVTWNLNPAGSLQSWFHRPGNHASLEEGLKLLGRLESQLAVLQDSDEEAREALAEWSALARQFRSSTSALPDTARIAAACESGMEELTKQILNRTDPLGLDDNDFEDSYTSNQEALNFEQMVDFIRQKAPAEEENSPETIKNRLHILTDVLYGPKGLKYEPFEWVYEGLKPLCLQNVLKSRKGTPAALAIAATSLGRRIGLPLLPMPAADIEAGAGQDIEAALVLENLPPDLALRVKNSTTQAAAPGPGAWILRLCTTQSSPTNLNSSVDQVSSTEEPLSNNSNSSTNSGTALYVDAGTGEILHHNDVIERYPAVANLSEEEWKEQCVLRTWQGLCRVAMQAHQRRGESDSVAHWMYITLAIDPRAPEWGRALTAPEIGGLRR